MGLIRIEDCWQDEKGKKKEGAQSCQVYIGAQVLRILLKPVTGTNVSGKCCLENDQESGKAIAV